MFDLSGRAALVTGGSRGIGRATALLLAELGADVAIGYLRDDAAAGETKTAIERFGPRGLACRADVSIPAAAAHLVGECLGAFGRLDILVNNAGITHNGSILETSFDTWQKVIDTNLAGPFVLMKVALPTMIARGFGRIINISSVSGQTGTGGAVPYSASKAGILGLTKAAAREVGPLGITVNAIAPGWVATDMTQPFAQETKDRGAAATPVGRFGTPEEIAVAVAFLASDEARYVTGQVLAVNGGFFIP
jgi:3-oxoacyl-[acyl-carrier protein] reductase